MIHSTGSLDSCKLHCSGTPCRLNCTSIVSLSQAAGKSVRVTPDWVCLPNWSCSTSSTLYQLALLFWLLLNEPNRQSKTNVGIPVNDNCMQLIIRPESRAYLNDVLGIVVIWRIPSKNQGEEKENDVSALLQCATLYLSICVLFVLPGLWSGETSNLCEKTSDPISTERDHSGTSDWATNEKSATTK